MTKVSVQGFDTANITEASLAAGEGGTVEFPTGVYVVDGLEMTVPNQTWIGERNSIIKRSDTNDTPLLSVLANGFRMRNLELDGSRYINTRINIGIAAIGHDLDIAECDIHSISHWGITQTDAFLKMIDVSMRKTGQAGVFWRILPTGVCRQGPHLERCNFERSDPSDYLPGSGCVYIAGQPDKKAMHVRILNSMMSCAGGVATTPTDTYYSSGGIVLFNAGRSIISGNNISGGRIGISIGDCDLSQIVSNELQNNNSYAIEVTSGSTNNLVTDNTIEGMGNTSAAWGVLQNYSTGVVVSNGSNGVRVTDNPVFACNPSIQVYPGCSGGLVRNG